MNTFEKALAEIRKDYNVVQFTTTYAQIEFDILFDDYNYIFIGVLFEDNKVILTDMADYAEICPWEDDNIHEVEAICQKYGVTFRNYHIERLYHSNDDIKKYLDCLLALKDKCVEK